VVIAEIYAGHTVKAYDRLKAAITDDNVDVDEKYVVPYTIKNWVQFFATSNSFRALKFDTQDRRWMVPGITEEGRPLKYFRALRHWLFEQDGLAVIAHWAQEYVKEHGIIETGAHAPTSTAKRHAIEESRSDGERLVHDLGMHIKEGKQKMVVRLDKIRGWLASKKANLDSRTYGDDGRLFLETTETISKVLHECRLQRPTKQFQVLGVKVRVVANFAIPDAAQWSDLEPHYREPEQVEIPF
jgi:hypothetical protein